MKKLFALALSAIAFSVSAQTWPQRPVTIVVPYGAGGNSDLIARLAASHLAPLLGQPVVVENRPGAAGLVAAKYVSEATADGHTLLMGTASQLVTAPFINPNIAIDPVKAFDPVVKIGDNAFIIAVRPQLNVKNLSEFANYAKANKASYGSGGTGGITHLASYLFAKNAGIDMLHVPYKGGAAAIADVAGGQIDMYSASPSEIISLAKSGKVKLLGISSKKRLEQLPNVPTIAETYPGHEVESWNGLLAPVGTPSAVLDRIAAETMKMKSDPNAKKKLEEAGITPVYLTRQDFATEIRQQTAMWEPVLKSSGIQAKD